MNNTGCNQCDIGIPRVESDHPQFKFIHHYSHADSVCYALDARRKPQVPTREGLEARLLATPPVDRVDLVDAIALIRAQEAKIRKLRDYVQHSIACKGLRDYALENGNPAERLPCTCGLLELLDAG